MARLPRLTLPGYPHHLIQRSHTGVALFPEESDYAYMHAVLVEQARQHGVAVHAYVLLPSRFQLLATPRAEDSLARMMQGVGRSYVRHFNAHTGRRGTLWEGRFRSAPLQPEKYLMDCMSYLDALPVRASLVQEAAQWAWSSHGHYTGLRSDRLVAPHPVYWQLGNTPFARELAYADRVAAGLPEARAHAFDDTALHGWVLGDEAFLADIQQRAERRVSRSQPGRPRTKLV
jgi:putative transposase